MSSNLVPQNSQLVLDLGIEVEQTVMGIEMGVLHDGTSYLTQRGLAKLCGAAQSTISEITQEWTASYEDAVITDSRVKYFRDYLNSKGFNERQLFIQIIKNGSPHYLYPESVCMAFVEYFAFEAQKTNETALKHYRAFAQHGLKQFIYNALQYTPEDKWRYFRDRTTILHNSVPEGYFSIFHEITPMLVDLINAGLTINHKTIPDISVGIAWAEHWTSQNLDENFGDRKTWQHVYPDYYPQAKSNPQEVHAYPDAALPLFRQWFRKSYLPKKFPAYILKKAANLEGGVDEAKLIASIYAPNDSNK